MFCESQHPFPGIQKTDDTDVFREGGRPTCKEYNNSFYKLKQRLNAATLACIIIIIIFAKYFFYNIETIGHQRKKYKLIISTGELKEQEIGECENTRDS
jgi:hypothetical protein